VFLLHKKAIHAAFDFKHIKTLKEKLHCLAPKRFEIPIVAHILMKTSSCPVILYRLFIIDHSLHHQKVLKKKRQPILVANSIWLIDKKREEEGTRPHVR